MKDNVSDVEYYLEIYLIVNQNSYLQSQSHSTVIWKSYWFKFIFRIMESIRRLFRWLWNMNLYLDAKTMREANQRILRDQVLGTRVYIVLLSASFVALVLITLLPKIEVKVTVSNPSLTTYDHLEINFLDTLSCSCERVAIPYKSFLTTHISFHEVRVLLSKSR